MNVLSEGFVTIGSMLKSKFSKLAEEPYLRETIIVAHWNTIIPKAIQENVRSIRLIDDVLHIKFESAIIRHTMNLNKPRLLEQLGANNYGYKVKDLVLF